MCMWQIIMNIPDPGVIVHADGGVGAPEYMTPMRGKENRMIQRLLSFKLI